MIYIIIAGFLALSLFFHSALDAETNITMIYKQLGWIAVILLLLTGEVCEKSKKIINTLNENNKIIDKSTYTQTFTETQEDAQQEEENTTKNVQKGYAIILGIIVIIALSVLCYAFSNKSEEDVKPIDNTYHTNIDNSHTPAAQMYK